MQDNNDPLSFLDIPLHYIDAVYLPFKKLSDKIILKARLGHRRTRRPGFGASRTALRSVPPGRRLSIPCPNFRGETLFRDSLFSPRCHVPDAHFARKKGSRK